MPDHLHAVPRPLDERITALAQAFPSLRDASGLAPWAPRELERWAVDAPETGRHAAAFVLSVWARHPWSCALGTLGTMTATPSVPGWTIPSGSDDHGRSSGGAMGPVGPHGHCR